VCEGRWREAVEGGDPAGRGTLLLAEAFLKTLRERQTEQAVRERQREREAERGREREIACLRTYGVGPVL
jgi:hypothetical protein